MVREFRAERPLDQRFLERAHRRVNLLRGEHAVMHELVEDLGGDRLQRRVIRYHRTSSSSRRSENVNLSNETGAGSFRIFRLYRFFRSYAREKGSACSAFSAVAFRLP